MIKIEANATYKAKKESFYFSAPKTEDTYRTLKGLIQFFKNAQPGTVLTIEFKEVK